MLTPQQLPPDVTKPLHARAKSTSWSPFSPACGAALTALLRVVQHIARAGPFNARWHAALSNAAEALSTASCVDRQLRIPREGEDAFEREDLWNRFYSHGPGCIGRTEALAPRPFTPPHVAVVRRSSEDAEQRLRWRATVPSPGHGQRMARGSAAVGRAELRQQGDSIDENS